MNQSELLVSDTSFYLLANKILGVYALVITISGTLLNLFSFFICLRLKKNTTFVFLATFSVANAFCLYWWNLNNFLKEFVHIDLLAVSLWVCKIGNFVQFTSLQISAWHLVMISLDRVLSIFMKHWRTIHFKYLRARIVSLLIVAIFLILNSNILVTFGYEAHQNGSVQIICFESLDYQAQTKWHTQWGMIHLMLYSVVPFIMLLILDLLLIIKLYNRKTNRQNTSFHPVSSSMMLATRHSLSHTTAGVPAKQQQQAQMNAVVSARIVARKYNNRFEKMNRIVILMTMLFIILTLPIACASSFFSELVKTDQGLFIIVLLDCVSFTYHGLNFSINYFYNQMFKNEVKRFLGLKAHPYFPTQTTINN